jgi:hypothetical protein
LLCPATIAIHDDGDVFGELLEVNLRLEGHSGVWASCKSLKEKPKGSKSVLFLCRLKDWQK